MGVKFDYSGFEQLRKNLEKLEKAQMQQFSEAAVKELAARLLRKVIKRTPVRKPEDCPPGVTGGNLRRGWTAGKENVNKKGNVIGVGGDSGYANNLVVTKEGNTYTIEIVNPVEYGIYVEYGHRTRDHKGWVEGRFMLTISEQELQADAPRILENKLKKFWEGIFSDK